MKRIIHFLFTCKSTFRFIASNAMAVGYLRVWLTRGRAAADQHFVVGKAIHDYMESGEFELEVKSANLASHNEAELFAKNMSRRIAKQVLQERS